MRNNFIGCGWPFVFAFRLDFGCIRDCCKITAFGQGVIFAIHRVQFVHKGYHFFLLFRFGRELASWSPREAFLPPWGTASVDESCSSYLEIPNFFITMFEPLFIDFQFCVAATKKSPHL